ncbi:12086_t:CDS:2 [Funneliformis caledonium]|uniref:12086_t:CDS:1 n=1 Tax=Funneliformis caledonium TaxID=1117310 RepID=A0A9N8VRG5_9GLOM|nr:12086_t:CDS:2 [Funneliformis caledonium]
MSHPGTMVSGDSQNTAEFSLNASNCNICQIIIEITKSQQSVSYSIVELNGDYRSVKLCVGEAVETTLSIDGQSAFGIIKGIIEHIWNDQVYVLIYLDWLEDLEKCDSLLGCPINRLQ